MLVPTRLIDIILNQCNAFPQKTIFNFKENGIWRSLETVEFVEKANQISWGLVKIGIQKGDLVILVTTNRMEWHLLDFAISQIGAVSVPLYLNLTTNEYTAIIEEALPKAIFVSSKGLYMQMEDALLQNNYVCPLYNIDSFENDNHYSKLFYNAYDLNILQEKRNAILPTDLLTIIYTSGTEGRSKGVMLSNNNIVSNILGIDKAVKITSKDRALTFLPLNHIYEKTLSYFYIYKGLKIFYAESIVKAIDNAKEVQPTIFSAVPLLIKKIYEAILKKGDELTGIKKNIFKWSLNLCSQWTSHSYLNPGFKIQQVILDALVYKKWRAALGGKIRILVSGSAALNPDYVKAFCTSKIDLLEGYGLTETSPVVSVNRNLKNTLKLGTVGIVFDDVNIKIADDGELLVKGPNVMMGYYKQPEVTAKVLSDDGWFSTGDIVIMEDNKFLKIIDRKKELFKTSSGKYVSPQYVEGKIKENTLVEQAFVHGSNEDVVICLLQPNWEKLKTRCEQNQIPFTNNIEIIETTAVRQLYSDIIKQTNSKLASHEHVRRFKLVPDVWSVETNELTPTFKLKRRNILAKYSKLIDELFKK